MIVQFPHLPREKTARLLFSLEMAALWGGLTTLIAVNILSIQKGRPAYWNNLMMLFEAPFSSTRYVDLASLLWKQGYREEARRLMAAAQPNVLGAATIPLETLSQWEYEARELQERYAFWQSVASERLDYRDAFITLAATAYQLRNQDDARTWLAKAYAIDPNSPTIQEFTKLLK